MSGEEDAGLAALLTPRSIAVVGASRRPGTVGAELVRGLVDGDFAGPVYPINPSADVVHAVPTYPNVAAVPGPVDLALVVVPAAAVVGVARECAEKGVRGIVVMSAGFGEAGAEGVRRQAELVEVCRGAGMPLVGPNCLGLLNTDPDVRLHAIFSSDVASRGRTGFLSQSGALGLAVIDLAARHGLGLSSFVSLGNGADVSVGDLLRHWEHDDDTDVILLYLEGITDARAFARTAARVSRSKPIVAVKSGRSAAGARAAGSHTGALVASSDGTVDALLRKGGIIRADTLRELIDVARVLESGRRPAGDRVAIVTNAGGPAILCADACAAEGLRMAELGDATRARLAAALPPQASVANPVDMIATASPEDYAEVLAALGDDPGIDAVIVIFLPALNTRTEDVAAALRTAAEHDRRTPILSVFMHAGGAERTIGPDVPVFIYPEPAARALSLVTKWALTSAHVREAPPALADVRVADARAVVARALEEGREWLEPEEIATLLDCYGVPQIRSRTALTAEDAAAAARELGGLVALKAVAPGLVHKTDAGAVRLGVAEAEVEGAVDGIARAVRDAGFEPREYLVQQMAGAGVEMLAGMVRDDVFGPVVAAGAGGVTAEVMADVAVELTPLSTEDAHDMIGSLRSMRLLAGFRGAPPSDVEAFADLLVRLGRLADEHPEVSELDLNPVIAGAAGATVVDARVRVRATTPG